MFFIPRLTLLLFMLLVVHTAHTQVQPKKLSIGLADSCEFNIRHDEVFVENNFPNSDTKTISERLRFYIGNYFKAIATEHGLRHVPIDSQEDKDIKIHIQINESIPKLSINENDVGLIRMILTLQYDNGRQSQHFCSTPLGSKTQQYADYHELLKDFRYAVFHIPLSFYDPTVQIYPKHSHEVKTTIGINEVFTADEGTTEHARLITDGIEQAILQEARARAHKGRKLRFNFCSNYRYEQGSDRIKEVDYMLVGKLEKQGALIKLYYEWINTKTEYSIKLDEVFITEKLLLEGNFIELMLARKELLTKGGINLFGSEF